MPMTFEYSPGDTRCTIRYDGVIERADLTAGIRAQIEAGAWTCETVIDTTAATGIQTFYADSQTVTHTITRAIHDHDLPPRGPIVIVVRDRKSAIYGMARMYEETTARDAALRVEVVFTHADIEPAFERLRAGPRH